jgi:hypothetical protein
MVNGVADALANQVGADGETLQTIFIQQVAPGLYVTIFAQGAIHFEVITPTSQFQAVKAPIADLLGQLFQGQIGPLAGK